MEFSTGIYGTSYPSLNASEVLSAVPKVSYTSSSSAVYWSVFVWHNSRYGYFDFIVYTGEYLRYDNLSIPNATGEINVLYIP